ncbi:Predicted outer membrane protein [uncultured Ruminococcus sp.]|uniref:SpaA isopeptide-forming pilin-related protein n=1 Tax=Hominimerdicola aceti TaxID=2981726 RepID=A0AAE3IJ94_9FIRM|nr:SpaA isopeptide-forming pilin-related protein [Hominimerdicola aceti]MCU6706910.1 SpaA isopeptide-forming pilin-related protein [Hominimerdicola aceti]SCJ28952.1 Predicted outer membrane protein [uncultured Ruminococcus sp.]
MFKKSKILKKLSAGFMAGLCAFSMLGLSMSGAITASAASTPMENPAFPSADTVIAKAATLLGSPYTYGNKGYWHAYVQGQYTPLSVETINNLGIDCSGLVYYTLTQLGYKTSGFSWNNPVPVDTDHWLTVNDNCTITYDGKTSKVEVEKKNIKTTDRPYWECADGSVITAGSVVVAQNPGGEDHAWIYMGEFDSRNDVISYLKSIGVSESLINSKTVGDGTGAGGTHWRIESNGSEGVVINNKTDGKTATAMNMSAFRITKNDVKFEITKVLASDRTVKISGTSKVDGTVAKYGVYTDKACKNKVGEITIGKDGTGSIQLPEKQYYVKEISAPTGYSISEEVFALKVDENIFVTEDFTRGTIKVNKTADDGIVSGREFKVTGNDGSSYTKKTKANGVAEFSGLKVYNTSTGKAITYTVYEINIDTRYEVPKAQNVTLTSGDVDLTVNVKFNNQLKTGSIKINKQSEDNQNGDREFTITGNGKTYTIKTGSDGVAILSDIPVYNSNNEKIVYTISEKNVPVRYVVPADQTATLTADATTTKTFKNILKKFTVEVTKQDSETTSAQGDGTLAGAVYGLYKDGELVDTYTTDESGYFKTKEYVCGNYTVQEISPSEGYLLDETVYSVGAEAENYFIEHNPLSMAVTEDVIKGNIAMIKHSDDGSTQIETPEVGAEFEVYLKSSGSYANAVETERDHLTCDENGFAQTKDMPYGVYTVHQTVGWEGTEFIADFDVNISKNGQTYRYLINNAKFESYIKIVKVDSETGKTIPYEGAGFEIYDSNGQKISMTFAYPTPTTIDTFYTNSEGYLITPEVLPYGEYSLIEVQAPYGYALDKTPVAFSVSSENAEKENSFTIVKVEKQNTAQKGKISVRKTGDIFTSVTTASSAYTNENGEMIVNPTTYTPVFANGDLSGAVFQVIAVEDIVMLDGTVRASAGDVVAEITTDENGYAETDLLYLGKYEIKEVQAPYGYVLNAESQFVELTYAGQEIAVRDTVGTAFENDYQGIEISLSKVMENDEKFGISAEESYKNVRFGLFAAEDITAADGSVIPADGLIAEVSLNEDMTAVIAEKIPFGKYYVQEIATDEHYVLNGKKYLVNFEYMGQEVTTVSIDCGQFVNELKRGKIEGIKVNESNEPLENALFGLFAVDTAEFTADNAYMTAVSDENGHFEFDKIPYGEYIVREIEAPTGYILSDESYPVTISEDGEIIEITAVNKPITVEISKQDVYGNELAGAEMQLENSDGKVVEKWTSDGTNHVVTELPAGDYTLKEIAAPDGYVIATDIRFTVDVYGKITVENVDATAVSENGNPLIVMVDDTTKVKISKRDITTDKELAGATLQIIDEDGNVATEWVSTDEAHFIEGKLIAGKEYTLRETIAPDGYEIASEIKFTVNTDGSVTEVVMYDEHTPDLETPPTVTIDTPNTGVSADNGAELYLVATAVIMTFGMLICKKNDKKQRKDDVK